MRQGQEIIIIVYPRKTVQTACVTRREDKYFFTSKSKQRTIPAQEESWFKCDGRLTRTTDNGCGTLRSLKFFKMALVFSSIIYDVLLLIAIAIATLYWSITRNADYWRKRNIPYIEPEFLFGNIREMLFFKKAPPLVMQDLYNKLDGYKYGGVFQVVFPALLLRDPEVIKLVMVKDFNHFQDRGIHVDGKRDPLHQHLVRLGGSKWRHLRVKLTPTFTSGKMKKMFSVMEECSRRLQQYLEVPASKGQILELKDVLAKFSTDVIGTCAFGLQMNALENPDSEFRKMGRKVFETTAISQMRRIVTALLPAVAKIFGIRGVDPEVHNFFMRVVKETVEYREKNNVKRNDFLQLLIELKNKGRVDDDGTEKDDAVGAVQDATKMADTPFELDDGLMAAQAFVFFLAGFETSSTTMSFALHELAINPHIQTKLREEVDKTFEECGGFTYEAIMNMQYLDKVISETLRKYPPVGTLLREVTIPYTLPDTGTRLDKGTKVLIPVHALHHDPRYFPEPDQFDPERFSEEQKSSRPHYVYLPFGEGPRNCIGMRFGLLQTKMGVAALLHKYVFHRCERTVHPLVIDPRSGVTASVSGTVLRVTLRD